MNDQIIQIIQFLIGTGVLGIAISLAYKLLDRGVTAYTKGKHSQTAKDNAIRFKEKAHDVVSYLERSLDVPESQYRSGAIKLLTDWATRNKVPFANEKAIGALVDRVIQYHKDNDYSQREAKPTEAPTEDNSDNANDQFKKENTNLTEDDVKRLIREEAGK